jgi:hypothetical protein
LVSGSDYKVGDLINMDVLLSGELSDADQIQFLTREGSGSFVVQKTQNLTGLSEYKYTWAPTQPGTYSFRITALKNGKYFTHVIKGGVSVTQQIVPLSIVSNSILSNENYTVGDAVNLSVELAGNLSDASEIKFLVKKDNGGFEVQKTSNISGISAYSYNWAPTEAGNYSLKATATINGQNVTSIALGSVTVEERLAPLSVQFASLNSGDNYKVGELVSMDVELFGNLNDADEIQYLIRKDDGLFTVQKTETLTGSSAYNFNWSPTQTGSYSFRVTALKNGQYITHVIKGGVTVEEAIVPLNMNFTSVNSGSSFNVLDTIPMNIELFGNLADADEIKFFVQKGNGAYEIQHALSIGSASNYNFNWIPSASGSYSLKAAATINGIDVTHIIVGNIVVEEPLGAKYIALRNQPVYKIGEKVKMNVALLGDFKHVTQLKFIVQKTGKSRSVVKSLNVSSNQDIYRQRWAPNGNRNLQA